ncbi:MAG TPA: glycoside hydrolase family 88 protein [Oceanipulchritudo sp.]|nr:glycoside hydrolase family 88 protein [Oceanipulchritudo sp.]
MNIIQKILLIFTGLVFPLLADGQEAEEVLNTTRTVAEKIIRETSFEYRNEPLSNNPWAHFQAQASDQAITIAKASLRAKETGRTLLGLAFEGSVSVFINGEEVFAGESDQVELREYTYNRFQSQELIPIGLQKGLNDVVVLCTGRDANVLMLPLNELDEPDHNATFRNLVRGPFASEWLVSGPYNGFPEEELLEFGRMDPGLNFTPPGKAWRVPSLPMTRQLHIPEKASFQRHPYSEWHYANGGTMLGMLNLYAVTGNEEYFQFVNRFTENIRENRDKDRWQFENIPVLKGAQFRLFRLVMLDDSSGPALPFVELKRTYGVSKYDDILAAVLEQVTELQDRLPDGTLCRSEPEINTIWSDDLFMSTPFLCRMALATGNESLFDDAARQIIQFNAYLMNPETGLYYHGYYADRDEPAPFQWGRANGWVTWAMSEVLMLMPEEHRDYKKILEIYRNHLTALVKYQTESGIWHQILTDPSTYQETSCTAMYTLSMARGINNGWLDDSFRDNAIAGWKAVKNKISEDGTVSRICRGTGIGTSVAFYNGRETFDHDPRGLGAVLTAGTEVYLMLKNE